MVNLAATVTTGNATLTAVDLTRSSAFSAGQITSGQAWGESAYSTGELFGEALGRQRLTTSTNVEVTRDSALGAAVFSPFVVQFAP